MNDQLKNRVTEALAERRQNFGGSDAKFATSLGINGAAYSRIKNGDTANVLSDANWISLARRLDVQLTDQRPWKIAVTGTFQFIMGQLEFCKVNAASRLLVDVPDIGKTFTARHFAANNKNTAYVDCSQVKSKQ
jgi:hypothetical protein